MTADKFDHLYQAIDQVGASRFSKVQSAKQLRTGVLVAVKTVDTSEEVPPHDVRLESRILQQCRHDALPRLVDYFEAPVELDDVEASLVLPLYHYDVNQVLAKHRKAQFPSGWRNSLDMTRAARIIAQVASGLAYLHSLDIIHRDLKPENIMFEELEGDAKIIDLGTAWCTDCENEPRDQKYTDVGTSCYRAPEVLFGKTDYCEKLDMWALGCVAAKLCSTDTKDLFGPYITDIGLISKQFEVMGKPTVEDWPDMRGVSSFENLLGGESAASSSSMAAAIAPRAPENLQRLIMQCLVFQASNRISAAEIHHQLG